jgi:predicted transcriptional regulator
MENGKRTAEEIIDHKTELRIFLPESLFLLTNLEEIKVFYHIFSNLVDNQWIHCKESREKAALEIGIAEITVKVALRQLLDSGFLFKEQRAVYQINPKYIR